MHTVSTYVCIVNIPYLLQFVFEKYSGLMSVVEEFDIHQYFTNY